MKFSALNADFSSPSAERLGLRRAAHESKIRIPSKKWLFYYIGWSSIKTAADRHMQPAYDYEH